MQNCNQTVNQSIHEHGISVKNYTIGLIEILKTGILDDKYKFPDWFIKYKPKILEKLYPINIVEEYTEFHDCSKPYCIKYDEEGKKHFPNHAELSYKKWLEVGGNQEAALLMKMDMDIHQLKDKNIEEFCNRPQAITLLIVGLAEVLSNAQLFGGYDSISFKIKYKQINKRGSAICKKIFGEVNAN